MTEQKPLPTDPLDEAFAAYLRSCDEGLIEDREEFLNQFPDVADQLRQLMEAADMVSMAAQDTSVAPGADTIGAHVGPGLSGGDPAATLPMAHRPKGDPGPTLPFALGDYTLLKVLGRGGMGVVYLAKQQHLDRLVAVKMIRSGILADESEVRRFYTEAQAVARLHHPGIVAVYQFGHRADHHFFSMEYIKGMDLQKKLIASPLPPREAARYVRDVARAIQHAHDKGVLHRDIKPANILIDANDQIHVTDFGLAKQLDADSSVTGTGAAVGTPHYMAPEQASGHSDRVCERSDVYSLGAILFACVTGRPPIVGDTVMQTLSQVVHTPAPPMRAVGYPVPADLETIVAKCLEKNRAKRYDSAADLADELDSFLSGRPIKARPRSRPMKTWHWLQGVPLVAALINKDRFDTSNEHRRFQAAMLLLLLMTPFVAVGMSIWRQRHRNAMPAIVRVAGGVDGGSYNTVARELTQRIARKQGVMVETIATRGSTDNQSKLLFGEVDLAPMQASAMRDSQLCVVAPLFLEPVHFLVHERAEIDSIDDLAGHSVAVGSSGSGSQAAAEMLFDSLSIDPNSIERRTIDWSELLNEDSPDAAFVCIGLGSSLVSTILQSGQWTLLPIPRSIEISEHHPTLRPLVIHAGAYSSIPDRDIATVGMTAFLAARDDSPASLVNAALDALYDEPELCVGLISKHRAAEWQGLDFHRVARAFFEKLAK